MRIGFVFNAHFLDAISGVALPVSIHPRECKLNEFDLDIFLDAEIADEGVVGGEFHLKYRNGQPVLEAYYWYSGMPSNQLTESLRIDTVAQLEDGVGEGGFEFEFDGKLLLILANTDEPGIIELIDDGRILPESPKIAIAARDGDLQSLAAALESSPQTIDRLHQGCTALHLAILYGHPNVVRQLLEAGANPNQIDANGNTPLEACALSNAINDEQSRDIGHMLLNAGGNPKRAAPHGESAKSYAESRGKKLLVAIL